MNEDEECILEAIKKWIWSGFYTESNVKEMIYDILEEGCNETIGSRMFLPEIIWQKRSI